MNVSQALKKKNRLVKEINQKWDIVHKHNSYISGNPIKYDIYSILDEIKILNDELIDLKAKIHLANSSVYDKIFKLSELKNYLKNLKSVNTNEGTIDNRYGTGSNIYSAQVDDVYKNSLIKNINDEIDKLQDELDYHNATTMI